MSASESLLQLFRNNLQQQATDVALRARIGDRPQEWTWQELAAQACRLAAALREAGVNSGDCVLHVSENRWEWVVTDIALQMASAVHVPVHAPLTGPQIAYQLAHSGARLAILSTPEQLQKLSDTQLSPDVKIWMYEPDPSASVGSVRDIIEVADAAVGERLFEAAIDAAEPDRLATILYTSGTTGEPKGVMLSERNLTSNTLAAIEAFSQRPDDCRLCFLPLSHIFARTCDLYTWLATGAVLALATSRETVIADCQAFRPTLLNGVPYFYDKVRQSLQTAGRDDAASLKQTFGGKMRVLGSGGAALPEHVFDFYAERDLAILQGYGLTETSPVITASTVQNNRRGASGRAVRDAEVKLAEDGEILTRGPHVMSGYFRDPQATNEVLKDGWFSTGDYGYLDEDGYLFVTGRKKEIIVTSGGKNIAPVLLEQLLVDDRLIEQAVVFGDDQKFLVALIVPDLAQLRTAVAAPPTQSDSDVLATPAAEAAIRAAVCERLAGLSRFEQVARFHLLETPFSIERGELTPKLSLRRQAIQQHYAAEIAALYAAE